MDHNRQNDLLLPPKIHALKPRICECDTLSGNFPNVVKDMDLEIGEIILDYLQWAQSNYGVLRSREPQRDKIKGKREYRSQRMQLTTGS